MVARNEHNDSGGNAPDSGEDRASVDDGAMPLGGKVHNRPVRWPRRLLIGLSLVAAITTAAFSWAFIEYNDQNLGRLISKLMTKALKGRFEIRKIHWSARALVDLALGTASPVRIEGITFYDPYGTEVIHVDKLLAKVKLWSAVAHRQVKLEAVQIRGGRVLVGNHREGKTSLIGMAETFQPTKAPKTVPLKDRKPGNVPLLDFQNIDVQGVRFRLLIDQTEIVLPNVRTLATLRIQGDPGREGIHLVAKRLDADPGFYRQHGLKVGLEKVRSRDVLIDGNRLAAVLRTDVGGAPTRIDGKLYALFSGPVALDITARMSRVAEPARRITKLPFTGRSGLVFRVRGPTEALKLRTDLRDLALGVGTAKLEDISATATFDVGSGAVRLPQVSAKALGGSFKGNGELDLKSGAWRVETKLAGADPGALVPALAGTLDGSVTLRGSLEPTVTGLAVVDLRLQRNSRRRDYLPRNLTVRGSAHVGTRVVDLAGLTVSADGNSARVRGSVNIPLQRANVFVKLELPAIGGWLRRHVGIDPVRRASGKLHVTGRWPRLVAQGTLEARDVGYGAYRLPRLGLQVSFVDGVVRVDQLRSKSFGGSLEGQGRLALFAGSLLAPLRDPSLEVRLRARDLLLEQVLGRKELARGRVSAEIELKGPVRRLSGVVEVQTKNLILAGQRYAQAQARIGLLGDRISVYRARLVRQGGGRLRIWDDVFFNGRLALWARMRDMPLVAIPGLAKLGIPIGGLLSGQVHLTGKIDDPRVAGRVSLARATIRGAPMGAGWIELKPDKSGIKIRGAVLNELLKLEGGLLVKPRLALHLDVDIVRFPVHRVVPELAKIGDIRGLVTGRVGLDLDEKRGLTGIDTRLSLVDFTLRYRPLGQRQFSVLQLRNDHDLLVRYNGHRFQVVTAKMISKVIGRKSVPRAEFSVGGFVDTERSDLRVRGVVPLEMAEFFLARRVKKISGRASADLRLTGPLTALALAGKLQLAGVKVGIPRFDRDLELPVGELTWKPKSVTVDRLRLRVGKSELAVVGRIEGTEGLLAGRLDGRYALAVAGDFNARLLRIIAPGAFSMASGQAGLRLEVKGKLDDPLVEGSVTLKKGHRLELKPRGLGRTIALTGGNVRIQSTASTTGGLTGYKLTTLAALAGTYDEGSLSLSGEASFDRQALGEVYLRLQGRSIPLRQPKVYAAEMNVDVTLVGDARSGGGTTSAPSAVASTTRQRCPTSKLQGLGHDLMLSGAVDVVDLRYVREFDIVKNAVIKPRVYEEDKPFWQGSKLLEQLGLCFTVRSTGQMKVKNRYAALGLETAMSVTGTLSSPRLDGTVRVEEGAFSIPFLRGQYKVDRGEIAFSETRPPVKSELNIDAETQYIDRNGTDYQIRLNLKGPLDRIAIKLTSQPVLDQGQILALLATGRTTDQLRTQLNRNAPGQGGAAGAADAQVKALSSMILSSILEDPIKKVTGLDLVRLEIGTETLTARGCKRIGSFELCGEYEKDLLGGFSGKGSANYKLHDYLRLVGRLERLSTRFEREQENPSRARLELKLAFPIR